MQLQSHQSVFEGKVEAVRRETKQVCYLSWSSSSSSASSSSSSSSTIIDITIQVTRRQRMEVKEEMDKKMEAQGKELKKVGGSFLTSG